MPTFLLSGKGIKEAIVLLRILIFTVCAGFTSGNSSEQRNKLIGFLYNSLAVTDCRMVDKVGTDWGLLVEDSRVAEGSPADSLEDKSRKVRLVLQPLLLAAGGQQPS